MRRRVGPGSAPGHQGREQPLRHDRSRADTPCRVLSKLRAASPPSRRMAAVCFASSRMRPVGAPPHRRPCTACALAPMPASSAPYCSRRPRRRPQNGDPFYVLAVHLDDRLNTVPEPRLNRVCSQIRPSDRAASKAPPPLSRGFCFPEPNECTTPFPRPPGGADQGPAPHETADDAGGRNQRRRVRLRGAHARPARLEWRRPTHPKPRRPAPCRPRGAAGASATKGLG